MNKDFKIRFLGLGKMQENGSFVAESTAPTSVLGVEAKGSGAKDEPIDHLFKELTTERNGLDLHLKHLRTLTHALARRIQVLNRTNDELQHASNRATSLPRSRFALPDWQSTLRPVHVGSDAPFYPLAADSLEFDRHSDLHLLAQEVVETIGQIQEVMNHIELNLDDTEHTTYQLRKTAQQIHTNLTQA